MIKKLLLGFGFLFIPLVFPDIAVANTDNPSLSDAVFADIALRVI